MCPPWAVYSLTHKRVTRSEVRWRKLYAFAADRFTEAKTPNAYRFWKCVMDRCVSTRIELIHLTPEEFARRYRL